MHGPDLEPDHLGVEDSKRLREQLLAVSSPSSATILIDAIAVQDIPPITDKCTWCGSDVEQDDGFRAYEPAGDQASDILSA